MLTIPQRKIESMRSYIREWFEQLDNGVHVGVDAVCGLIEMDLFSKLSVEILDLCQCETADRVAIHAIRDAAFGVRGTHSSVNVGLLSPRLRSWYLVCQWSVGNEELVDVLGQDPFWEGNVATAIALRRYIMGEIQITDEQLTELLDVSNPGLFRLLVTAYASSYVLNISAKQSAIVARNLVRLSSSLQTISDIWDELRSTGGQKENVDDDSILNVPKVSSSLVVIESIMLGIDSDSDVQEAELLLVKNSVDTLIDSIYSSKR